MSQHSRAISLRRQPKLFPFPTKHWALTWVETAGDACVYKVSAYAALVDNFPAHLCQSTTVCPMRAIFRGIAVCSLLTLQAHVKR